VNGSPEPTITFFVVEENRFLHTLAGEAVCRLTEFNRKLLRSFLRPLSCNFHVSGNKANRQPPKKPTDFRQVSRQTG